MCFLHFLLLIVSCKTMHHKNPSFLSWFMLLVVLILINGLVPSAKSAFLEDGYANCAPMNSTCSSSNTVITYPFWDSPRLSYCGHPGFGLECQSGVLTIQMNNQTYNVLDINYESNILRISKQQFSQTACPESISQLVNTSINYSLFNFSPSSENVTLFYNCSRKFEKVPPFGFACLTDIFSQQPGKAFKTLVNFVSTGEKWEDELRKICGIEIYLPVLRTKVIDLYHRVSSVNVVVNNGFEVTWSIDESGCRECLRSGGRCGYNQTLNQPICFCKNGACAKTDAVQGLKSKKKGIVIGLGVAAVVGVVLLISLVCFFYPSRQGNQSFIQRDSGKNIPNTVLDTLNPQGKSYFGVKVFTYSELEQATNCFSPARELGRGSFGIVYHGILNDGTEVAIKRLHEKTETRVEQFLNEVEILANLRHNHLVILYGCTSHECDRLLLVYEYVSNGSLADHIHGKNAHLRQLPWPTRLKIARETASALLYLHSSDIVHRDVKTENILLGYDFCVKVADFGLSRLFPLDATHVSTIPKGSPGYIDPEYHQCFQLTRKSDVYSFGVVLAELISSKQPIDITRPRAEIKLSSLLINKMYNDALDELIDPLIRVENDDTKKEIKAVAELALQCLTSTREARPSMEQVVEKLQHIQDRDRTTKYGITVIPEEVSEITSADD